MPIIPEALKRLLPGRTRVRNDAPALNEKGSAVGALIAYGQLGQPVWSPRDYEAFAREGFMQNAIVYRCVRMVAEAAGSIPILLYEGGLEIEDHPFLDLMKKPSLDHTGTDFLESWYGFLLVAGNAYVEAVALNGEVRELHVLRPDRMKVIPGPDGWPEGYTYTAAGQSVRFEHDAVPGVRPILHVRLFHPDNDHYGMSPIEAAAVAIDIHNTAANWNKALLDNSARPSGALVYAASNGQMSGEQFERLKGELETSFSGAAHAGRPLLLEGGLDWKPLSLTPKDMDFIEAKNAAAREIALALGVPPMLLGIPGDNTYSNYQEAQRAFWRQTVLPLVNRTLQAFSMWLSPAYATTLELKADLDQVEALSTERDALWKRLESASFLTDDEKRAAAGYGPKGAAENGIGPFDGGGVVAKYREDQPRVPAGQTGGGRWTGEDGGVHVVGLGDKIAREAIRQVFRRIIESLRPKPRDLKLEDILKPNGKDLGTSEGGAGDNITTLTRSEFDQVKSDLLDGASEASTPSEYAGQWYQRPDGSIVGFRASESSGETMDVIQTTNEKVLPNGYKLHYSKMSGKR